MTENQGRLTDCDVNLRDIYIILLKQKAGGNWFQWFSEAQGGRLFLLLCFYASIIERCISFALLAALGCKMRVIVVWLWVDSHSDEEWEKETLEILLFWKYLKKIFFRSQELRYLFQMCLSSPLLRYNVSGATWPHLSVTEPLHASWAGALHGLYPKSL